MMEINEHIKKEVERIAAENFANPTDDLGVKLEHLFMQEASVQMEPALVFEINSWTDIFEEINGTWREFVQWLWFKIKQWWKSLWD